MFLNGSQNVLFEVMKVFLKSFDFCTSAQQRTLCNLYSSQQWW